jgi:hypothetical protein
MHNIWFHHLARGSFCFVYMYVYKHTRVYADYEIVQVWLEEAFRV